MDNSRVLKQLNRSDARAERDVAALKNRDVKPAVSYACGCRQFPQYSIDLYVVVLPAVE